MVNIKNLKIVEFESIGYIYKKMEKGYTVLVPFLHFLYRSDLFFSNTCAIILECHFFGTFLMLLHAPLKQAAGELLRLLDIEAEHFSLHGREMYGAGLSFLYGVAVGIGHRQPLSLGILVFNVPRLRNLASAPRLVVVPVDGGRLYLLWFLKGVGDPFCGTLLGPPMEIRYRAVVLIGRYQSVGNTLHRGRRCRRSDDGL